MTRLWYRLEKGYPHAFAFLLLVCACAAVALVGGVVAWATGQTDPLASLWWAILHVSDTGYLGDDAGPVKVTLGAALSLCGLVLVGAGLNAVMTSLVIDGLERIRAGGHEVAFREHTVILGWNSRLFGVVEELLLGSDTVEIAILGELAKEDAERELERRVFRPLDVKDVADPRRRVVYREGSALVATDLARVGCARASRFLLLAPTDARGTEADVRTLRAYEVLKRAWRARNDAPLTTVLEIREITLRYHAFLAAGVNPRVDRWVDAKVRRRTACGEASHLPEPAGERASAHMTLVHGDELVARALAQTTIEPMLARAFDQMLKVAGQDVWLLDPREWEPEWKALFAEILAAPAHQRHARLAARVAGGSILGLYVSRNGAWQAEFDAAAWDGHLGQVPFVVLGPRNVKLRVVAGDPQLLAAEPARHPEPSTYRVLFLGYNHRFPLIIEQLAEFAHNCKGLELSVSVVSPDLDVVTVEQELERRRDELRRWNEGADHQSRLVPGIVRREDFTRWEVLSPLLTNPYDAILLLAEDGDLDGNHVDGRVILGLVMLRSFRNCPSRAWTATLGAAHVVAEIIDPLNKEVVDADPGVGDVVVSTEVVSRFMAQIAADPRVEEVYRELLDYGDWEIYGRPATDYAPKPTTWGSIVATAGARQEVAIGFARPKPDVDKADWVVLAPGLDRAIQADDRVLIIARS